MTCNLKLVCAFVLASAGAHAAVIFDAVTDFGVSANPNGVWTYGGAADNHSDLLSIFSLHDSSAQFAEWTNGPTSLFPLDYPLIEHASVPLLDGTSLYQPDELRMAAGDVGAVPDTIAVLRFTAPQSGSYTFTGSFQAEDDGTHGGNGTKSEASINVDLAAAFLIDEVNGGNGSSDPHPFAFTLALSSGSTVDFRVNSCQPTGCNFFSDNTGLTLQVSLDSTGGATPEPGCAVLVAGGLAAVLLRYRRYRPA